MSDGMTAPDLDLDLSGYRDPESSAAGAQSTQSSGAAGQAAASGLAPASSQGAGAATGSTEQSGTMPSDGSFVPRTDLDNLRSTYDRQLADLRKQAEGYQSQSAQLAQALWELRVAGMSPDERREAESALQFQSQLHQLAQAAAAQQSQMQALEPVLKNATVKELVEQYAYAGVKREHLQRFDDPTLMEAFCEAMVEHHKVAQATRQQPANQAAAAAGAGAPPAANFAKMDFTELAALAFG